MHLPLYATPISSSSTPIFVNKENIILPCVIFLFRLIRRKGHTSSEPSLPDRVESLLRSAGPSPFLLKLFRFPFRQFEDCRVTRPQIPEPFFRASLSLFLSVFKHSAAEFLCP